MNRRQTLVELAALGISVAVLLSQYPDIGLALHRVMLSSLQTVARVTGSAALKVEAAYRVKVAP